MLLLKYYYFVPGRCEVSWWACLRVCLLSRLKNHMSKRDKIFCPCFLWPWLARFSSDDNAISNYVFLGHITRTTYVDAVYYYRPSSVVCHTSEPCKNGWTDQDAVCVEDLGGGPRESCIRWGPDPSMGRGNFWGKVIVNIGLSAVSCARVVEPINWRFGLWTRVGQRKHKFNHIHQVASVCPQYHWTVHVRRRCGLLSNYFNHLLVLWMTPCLPIMG